MRIYLYAKILIFRKLKYKSALLKNDLFKYSLIDSEKEEDFFFSFVFRKAYKKFMRWNNES